MVLKGVNWVHNDKLGHMALKGVICVHNVKISKLCFVHFYKIVPIFHLICIKCRIFRKYVKMCAFLEMHEKEPYRPGNFLVGLFGLN